MKTGVAHELQDESKNRPQQHGGHRTGHDMFGIRHLNTSTLRRDDKLGEMGFMGIPQTIDRSTVILQILDIQIFLII